MSKDEWLNLLGIFQKNNTAIDVTGLLLYNGHGICIQVLEGEQAVIETLYDKIQRDFRHRCVNYIGKKVIEKRSFPNWTMGFKSLKRKIFLLSMVILILWDIKTQPLM